jgi:hypothetical protein
MKNQDYEVSGYFYRSHGKPCRRELYIKTKGCSSSVDLLVIMMNPGSSHPKNTPDYKNISKEMFEKIVPTEPDKTQHQIMDFMKKHDFKHACILNLSDLCNQKSEELTSATILPCSNFNTPDSARKTIENYAPNVQNIVVAWGCKRMFKPLILNAKLALAERKNTVVFGFNQLKDNKSNFFYHPLVRDKNWLENLSQINFCSTSEN